MGRRDYINLLPKELLSDVFIRLPAKSLGQCKCVSKSWKSLISDPNLIQTHLIRASVTKLMLISFHSDPCGMYTTDFFHDARYDYKNPNCKKLLKTVLARMKAQRETKKKLNFKNSSNRWTKVWGSCYGLILVQNDLLHPALYVLNPTTLESRKLPLLPLQFYQLSTCNTFGFGYDFSCDDYAVVAISSLSGSATVAYVFMLKASQWKRVADPPFDLIKRVAGIFLEGSLHWLSEKSMIIWAYNIAEKEFSGVPLPIGVFDSNSVFPRLGVLKGCLCLFSNVINSVSELYVMKEYGVVGSWTKLSVVLSDVSHVASLNFRDDSSGFPEHGDSVLLVSNAKFSDLYDTEVLGLPNDFRVGMTFVESLVSPEKDGNKKTTETIPRPRQCRYDDMSGWLKAW